MDLLLRSMKVQIAFSRSATTAQLSLLLGIFPERGGNNLHELVRAYSG